MHHAREKCAEAYPRDCGRPHTGPIPLHSRGCRTREASHGEGGLQADRGGRNPRKRGSAHKPGLKCQGACDLKCVPRPKILRGAVKSRLLTKSDADLHRPAPLELSLLLTPAELERQEETARGRVDGRRRTVRRARVAR